MNFDSQRDKKSMARRNNNGSIRKRKFQARPLATLHVLYIRSPKYMKSCNQFGAARSEDLRKIIFGTPHQFGIRFKMTILRRRATISTYDLKESFISWQSQAKKTQEQPEASSYVPSLRTASDYDNPGPTAVFSFT